MERIGPSDARISDWAVRAGSPAVDRDTSATEPGPDPLVLLEQQRQRVLEAAKEEGYRSGLLHAEEAINARAQAAEERIREIHLAEGQRLRDANEQLAGLLQALPRMIERLEAGIEAASIEVAYAAVVRLLGEHAADRTLIAQLCTQALADYRQRPVTIRLATQDVDCVEHLLDGDAIVVVADNRLLRGQCQLETHKGLFDTGVEVRLEALKQALLRGLAAPGAAA